MSARHTLNGPLIKSGFGDCEPDDDGRDPEQAREDAVRAEIDGMDGPQLEAAVIDALYDYPLTEQRVQLARRRVGALFAALQAAERDGALPPEVALAWDLVLARVVDETIAHQDRRGRL